MESAGTGRLDPVDIVLPAPVLADQGTAFDADLTGTHGPFADDGTVHQAVGFVCELGRRGTATT